MSAVTTDTVDATLDRWLGSGGWRYAPPDVKARLRAATHRDLRGEGEAKTATRLNVSVADKPPVVEEPPATDSSEKPPFITKQIIDAELARRVGDFVITRQMVNTELDRRLGAGWRDLEPSVIEKLRAVTHLNLRAEGRRPEAPGAAQGADAADLRRQLGDAEERHGWEVTSLAEINERLLASNTRLGAGNARLHAEWTRVATERARLTAALRQVGDIVGSTYLGTERAHAALGVIGQVARSALWRTQS